ncbi:MAG: glycoside hydrolase family 3 N-terminal domain-containing protein, partial [Mycobacteriales bacterium]
LPLGRLGTTGLVPFHAAVAAGAPAVMVANASVPGLTSLPATLAAPVVEGLLRGRLGFRGLVVTDSLSAGAVLTGGRTLPAAVVGAVAAGADLVLFGSTLTARDRALLSPAALRRSFTEVRAALVAAVADGRLPRARLVAAATAVTRAAGDPTCS